VGIDGGEILHCGCTGVSRRVTDERQSVCSASADMENEAGVLDDRHHWLVDKLVETFRLQDRALAENFVKYAIPT